MRRIHVGVAGTAAFAVALLIPTLYAAPAGAQHATSVHQAKIYSGQRCPRGPLCAEIGSLKSTRYIGHDEPAALFYSNKSGAGNNVTTTITLPKDPPALPAHGGTPNFELRATFWLGMAMCDDQSAPNPGATNTVACTPDSDSNIYTSTNPSNSKYIGLHPGTAFMELQFYPPGFVDWPAGDSCDATQWCVAMNIDSLSENYNTGQVNNEDCSNYPFGGIEPVNFAFVTKNGVAQAPANPVDATQATYTPDPSQDLFMSSGDKVRVHMFDTPAGFEASLNDLTKGVSGSMTASTANGFGHVVFDPSATQCTVDSAPFHPEYASSSPSTRVPWAAHSYNVAYSDEIGHFEPCVNGTVNEAGGNCESASDPESGDDDDTYCFDKSDSSFYQVSGCYGEDDDFDGPPYLNDWPGTLKNAKTDAHLHSQPVTFTPFTFSSGGKSTKYSQVAFEADLPRIEQLTTPPCQRHLQNPTDPSPGAGCVGLPAGAKFYPIFSTTGKGRTCEWREGGPYLPNTVNDFGGTSSKEFGTGKTHILGLTYPDPGNKVSIIYEDYRNILKDNPC